MNPINPEKEGQSPLDNIADGIINQLQQPLTDTDPALSNRATFFSSVYTLFDEIVKLHIKSYIFYFIQAAVIFLHLVGASWYCYMSEVWDDSDIIGKIVIGINSILSLSGTNTNASLNLPQILIPFFWNLIIAVLFLVLILILKGSGTISQYLVYTSAFVFQVLLFIGFLPSFAAFAATFKFLLEKDPVAIVFFILYIFILAFLIVFLNTLTRLICYTTNPTIAPFVTYSGHHVKNLIIFEGITIILTQMSQLFQRWFYIVAIIVHVVFLAYQMFDLFSYPFVRLWCHPVFAGFYSASFVTDILTLITLFGLVLSPLIRFIVPIGIFIVASIVFYVVFHGQTKAIAAILDPEDVPDVEKMSYFEQLEVKNVRQATIYLHIGFSSLKPIILDGSLGLLFARKYHNYDLWLLVANIAAFVPCNKPQLNECITKLRSIYSKTNVNRLLLQRLVKLEQSRALVSTNDINNKIQGMKTKTDDAVNAVKQFWNEISMKDERATAASINSISAIVSDASRSWDEMLSMYPNEPRLAAEYSNFLIECLGKFELGIIWRLKSGHLEKGFHAGIDPLFQAFVISMPRVWYDHMVDRLGNLSQGVALDVTTHTTTATTTAQDKLEEDLEVGMLDQVAVQMFQWPRLRMNLTRATSHYRPKGLGLFRILKYIAFLIWVVLLMVTTVFYSTTFDKITVTFERMESLVSIRVAIDTLRTLIFLNYAKRENMLYTEAQFEASLPKEALQENGLMFNYINFTESFKDWSTVTLDSFIDIYRTFADSGLSGENVTRIVAAFLNETIPRLRRQGNKVTTITTSSKNAIISLLWNYEAFSNMSNPLYDTFLNSTVLFETSILHQQFSFQSADILADFSIQASENSEDIQKFVQLLIIIDLVLTIVVCLPLMYVPLIIISMETSKIFKALKSVSVDGAKAASKQLSMSSNQSIDFSAAQNINSTSGTIIIMCVLYTIFFIAAIVLSGIAYAVLKSKGTYVSDLIDLSRFGSAREALVAEIFGIATMISVSVREPSKNLPYYSAVGGLKPTYDQTVAKLNEYHAKFFQGYDGKEGIYTISDRIRDFHIVDKCGTDLTKGEMHPFYACVALERLLSTFQLYSLDFSSNLTTAPTMSSSSFANLVHLTTSELYKALSESRSMMRDLIHSSSSESETISIVLLVIALLIVLANVVIDLRLERTLLRSLKTTLVLLRHLPPPVVAETPALIDILLVKKSEESEEVFDPKQIIFNTTQSPIICIGDGFIIETINKAFRRAFNFSNEQLVGRKLTSLIEEPRDHEGDKSVEEQGAFRMYEKMRLMLEHDEDLLCNYPIQCICGDEEPVNTTVSVYPVHDKANHISNFVLMIEDRRESSEIEAKLEAAKRESAMLLSQLVPREVAAFMNGKGDDFAFAAKCATVTAVQIVDALELLNESNDRLDDLFALVENLAHSHPPFIKVKTLYDTLFFVGGLFAAEDTAHANVSIEFGKDVKKDLLSELPEKNGKSRFAVAIITGGPLVCCLTGDKHKTFEVIGELLDDALELLTAAPPDSIILTDSTKELLNEQNVEGMASGPAALQQKTYLL